MAIRPLTVAAAAAALLVATLVVDASMNREVKLEARDGATWRTVLEDPVGEVYRGPPPSYAPLEVDPNGTLEMRVQFDNGYPWTWSEEYAVLANGREIARGHVDAPPRAVGEASFTVPVRDLIDPGAYPAFPKEDQRYAYPSLELVVGSKHHYGNLVLEATS